MTQIASAATSVLSVSWKLLAKRQESALATVSFAPMSRVQGVSGYGLGHVPGVGG